MTTYIFTDPAVCAGEPHITGTRISVAIIKNHLAAGYTFEEIRKIYYHLSIEQISAAARYDQPVTTVIATQAALPIA